jgi:hypothetical protein
MLHLNFNLMSGKAVTLPPVTDLVSNSLKLLLNIAWTILSAQRYWERCSNQLVIRISAEVSAVHLQ